MKHYVKKFFKIFLISFAVFAIAVVVAFVGAILGYWGGVDDLDIDSMVLNQNSVIVYENKNTGGEVELQTINAAENREWVDIEEIPQDLQDAFIAIEDERFMEHRGYDIPRTVKATFTWFGNKLIGKTGATLGGSTITQQLIKNITGENDQTPIRKIKEISRAASVEKQLDKTQILELYLNCIYLSHGCNGVQTASTTYFDKDAKELTLAECASIAGITQNPAAYDPIDNPENNKRRQEIVLLKMLELDFITQEEYDSAINEKLDINSGVGEKTNAPKTNSYYVDQVIRDVIRDLEEMGYSTTLANKIVYNGGVKIHTPYDPDVQNAVEKYYNNKNNFYGSGIQSAITIIDVRTGEVKGIAGGIGEKEGSLTLNRASQSPRQPGSTIKPIAAYAPAIDKGLISPCSVYEDKAKSYGGWTPRNYDYSYRGSVDVRTALRKSLNTTPVEIINQMGAQESYDFLTQRFGFTTLVESRNVNGKIYSDIGLSQLALGGLTDGMTTLEMAAAYSAFANGGYYYKPHTYTKVEDHDGNVILTADKTGKSIMHESTAYIMTQMLKEVVTSGTGGGAAIPNASYTAGKTGTTSDNNDRWFVGYTPYYAAAIWYGYDIPKEIYASNNPCIPVFRSIMTSIHSSLDETGRRDERPDEVVTMRYCAYTGKRASSACPGVSYYGGTDLGLPYCNGKHAGLSLPVGEEEDKEEDEEETEEGEEGEASSGTESGTASDIASGTTGGTASNSGGATGTSEGQTGATGGSAATGSGTASGGTQTAPSIVE